MPLTFSSCHVVSKYYIPSCEVKASMNRASLRFPLSLSLSSLLLVFGAPRLRSRTGSRNGRASSTEARRLPPTHRSGPTAQGSHRISSPFASPSNPFDRLQYDHVRSQIRLQGPLCPSLLISDCLVPQNRNRPRSMEHGVHRSAGQRGGSGYEEGWRQGGEHRRGECAW